MTPLVTVICCSYNAGDSLVESILSILGQTYSMIELIVVDDGSTDGSISSLASIEDRRISIIRQENAGKSVGLNRALSRARGEFYAIQDADDVSKPDRVAKQVAFLMQYPDIAAVFCGHELVIEGRHCAPRFRKKSPEDCRRDIMALRMPAHDPTVMYRLAQVREFEYNPALRIGQGYDHILRVGEKYPMAVLGECLYAYRISRDSITRRVPEKRLAAVAAVQAEARTRRGSTETAQQVETSIGQRMADNNLAAHFMESVVDLRRAGRYWSAFFTATDCIRLCPTDLHYYKALAYAVLPDSVRHRIRPSERATLQNPRE